MAPTLTTFPPDPGTDTSTMTMPRVYGGRTLQTTDMLGAVRTHAEAAALVVRTRLQIWTPNKQHVVEPVFATAEEIMTRAAYEASGKGKPGGRGCYVGGFQRQYFTEYVHTIVNNKAVFTLDANGNRIVANDSAGVPREGWWTKGFDAQDTLYSQPGTRAIGPATGLSTSAQKLDFGGYRSWARLNYWPRVNGKFPFHLLADPTEDEILQFYALKWGLDPEILRGVLMQESGWKQRFIGDLDARGTPARYRDGSWGWSQIKREDHGITWPASFDSILFNTDWWCCSIRIVYDGGLDWWHGDTVTGITLYTDPRNFTGAYTYTGVYENADDIYGAIAAHFDGGAWRNANGNNYIGLVTTNVQTRKYATKSNYGTSDPKLPEYNSAALWVVQPLRTTDEGYGTGGGTTPGSVVPPDIIGVRTKGSTVKEQQMFMPFPTSYESARTAQDLWVFIGVIRDKGGVVSGAASNDLTNNGKAAVWTNVPLTNPVNAILTNNNLKGVVLTKQYSADDETYAGFAFQQSGIYSWSGALLLIRKADLTAIINSIQVLANETAGVSSFPIPVLTPTKDNCTVISFAASSAGTSFRTDGTAAPSQYTVEGEASATSGGNTWVGVASWQQSAATATGGNFRINNTLPYITVSLALNPAPATATLTPPVLQLAENLVDPDSGQITYALDDNHAEFLTMTPPNTSVRFERKLASQADTAYVQAFDNTDQEGVGGTYWFGGLSPDTEYDFRCFFTQSGQIVSNASNVVRVRTLALPLEAPATFTKTDDPPYTVTLQWPAVTDATGYVVREFRNGSNTPTRSFALPGGTLSLTPNDLYPLDSYLWTVEATAPGRRSTRTLLATNGPLFSPQAFPALVVEGFTGDSGTFLALTSDHLRVFEIKNPKNEYVRLDGLWVLLEATGDQEVRVVTFDRTPTGPGTLRSISSPIMITQGAKRRQYLPTPTLIIPPLTSGVIGLWAGPTSGNIRLFVSDTLPLIPSWSTPATYSRTNAPPSVAWGTTQALSYGYVVAAEVDTTFLPQVTNVQATAADTSVSASWAAVVGATSYEITFNGAGVSESRATPDLQTYVTGLPFDTDITVRVRARNTTTGAIGIFSDPVVVRTAAEAVEIVPAPAGLTATTTPSEVRLRWNAVDASVLGYHVYRAVDQDRNGEEQRIFYVRLTGVPITALTYTDVLAPALQGEYLLYIISAVGITRETDSFPIAVNTIPVVTELVTATLTALPTPQDATAGKTRLAWPKTSYADGYDIERNGVLVTTPTILVSNPGEATERYQWTDETVPFDTEISYRVRGKTGTVVGPWNLPLRITIPTPPPPRRRLWPVDTTPARDVVQALRLRLRDMAGAIVSDDELLAFVNLSLSDAWPSYGEVYRVTYRVPLENLRWPLVLKVHPDHVGQQPRQVRWETNHQSMRLMFYDVEQGTITLPNILWAWEATATVTVDYVTKPAELDDLLDETGVNPRWLIEATLVRILPLIAERTNTDRTNERLDAINAAMLESQRSARAPRFDDRTGAIT